MDNLGYIPVAEAEKLTGANPGCITKRCQSGSFKWARRAIDLLFRRGELRPGRLRELPDPSFMPVLLRAHRQSLHFVGYDSFAESIDAGRHAIEPFMHLGPQAANLRVNVTRELPEQHGVVLFQGFGKDLLEFDFSHTCISMRRLATKIKYMTTAPWGQQEAPCLAE